MNAKLLLLFLLPLFTQAENKDNKWISLFDGKTTDGWTPRGKVEKFEAIDGELHLLSKGNVWVLSDLELKNFEVECEAKIPLDYEKFNSGLGFRLSNGSGKFSGYQCEIDRAKPCGIYGIGRGGWLYPSKATQEEYKSRVEGIFSVDEWNHFRVVCKGTEAKTFINGKLIAEVSILKSVSGHFGIQHHGKGGIVKFRNLRTRKTND